MSYGNNSRTKLSRIVRKANFVLLIVTFILFLAVAIHFGLTHHYALIALLTNFICWVALDYAAFRIDRKERLLKKTQE